MDGPTTSRNGFRLPNQAQPTSAKQAPVQDPITQVLSSIALTAQAAISSAAMRQTDGMAHSRMSGIPVDSL